MEHDLNHLPLRLPPLSPSSLRSQHDHPSEQGDATQAILRDYLTKFQHHPFDERHYLGYMDAATSVLPGKEAETIEKLRLLSSNEGLLCGSVLGLSLLLPHSSFVMRRDINEDRRQRRATAYGARDGPQARLHTARRSSSVRENLDNTAKRKAVIDFHLDLIYSAYGTAISSPVTDPPSSPPTTSSTTPTTPPANQNIDPVEGNEGQEKFVWMLFPDEVERKLQTPPQILVRDLKKMVIEVLEQQHPSAKKVEVNALVIKNQRGFIFGDDEEIWHSSRASNILKFESYVV